MTYRQLNLDDLDSEVMPQIRVSEIFDWLEFNLKTLGKRAAYDRFRQSRPEYTITAEEIEAKKIQKAEREERHVDEIYARLLHSAAIKIDLQQGPPAAVVVAYGWKFVTPGVFDVQFNYRVQGSDIHFSLTGREKNNDSVGYSITDHDYQTASSTFDRIAILERIVGTERTYVDVDVRYNRQLLIDLWLTQVWTALTPVILPQTTDQIFRIIADKVEPAFESSDTSKHLFTRWRTYRHEVEEAYLSAYRFTLDLIERRSNGDHTVCLPTISRLSLLAKDFCLGRMIESRVITAYMNSRNNIERTVIGRVDPQAGARATPSEIFDTVLNQAILEIRKEVDRLATHFLHTQFEHSDKPKLELPAMLNLDVEPEFISRTLTAVVDSIIEDLQPTYKESFDRALAERNSAGADADEEDDAGEEITDSEEEEEDDDIEMA